MGIGSRTGGIISLTSADEELLKNAHPGLLALQEERPAATEVLLKSRLDQGILVSEGALSNGITILRKIQAERISPYLVRMEIELSNKTGEPKELSNLFVCAYRTFRLEDPKEQQFSAGTVWAGGKSKPIAAGKKGVQTFEAGVERIASQGRSSVFIAEVSKKSGLFHVEHPQTGTATGWLELPVGRLGPGEWKRFSFRLFAGPMVLSELEKAGMSEAFSFGAFSNISRGLLKFLAWSEQRLHSYGWAICLLSVAVWLPFSPITWYGMKVSQETMRKMTSIRPQEARIRKENGSNPQKMQKEIMELYRKHKINPAGGCIGCLPFLLTWPLYIALFQVLNRAPELRGAAFLWIRDLSAPDALIRFSSPVPLVGSGIHLLPVLSAGLALFQQKAMAPSSAALTEEQKVQQQMFKFLPILFLFIFYNLPSGFMLYWVVNSALMGGQQFLLSRALVGRVA